jgi:hypothetical protein
MPTLAPAPAVNFLSKAWIGSADPITSGNGIQLDFQRFGLQRQTTLTNLNGMRGTRSQFAARTRSTAVRYSGPLVLEPTPVEMAGVIKYALGGTPVGTSMPLSDTLAAFVTGFLKGGQRYYTFGGCKVDRLRIEGGPGRPMQLTLDVMALTRSKGAAGTAPGGTSLDTTTVPYVYSDLVLTVGGNTQDTFNYVLEVNNFLDPRQVNALAPTALTPTDRSVTVTLEPAWGDNPDIDDLDPAGVPVTAVWTAGATSLTLSTPLVQFGGDDGEAAGRTEIHFPMTGMARASAAGNELAVTLDSTP